MQRGLAGYSAWIGKELETTEWISTYAHTHTLTQPICEIKQLHFCDSYLIFALSGPLFLLGNILLTSWLHYLMWQSLSLFQFIAFSFLRLSPSYFKAWASYSSQIFLPLAAQPKEVRAGQQAPPALLSLVSSASAAQVMGSEEGARKACGPLPRWPCCPVRASKVPC